MRTNKGITMISLVVTITILLILTGISIGAIAGNNGIIQRFISGSEKAKISESLEELKTKVKEYQIENTVYDVSLEEYVDYIVNNKIADADKDIVDGETEDIKYIIQDDEFVFTAEKKEEDGRIEITYNGKLDDFNNQTSVITFSPGIGTVKRTIKRVLFGTTYGELPEAEVFGYTFVGWFTEPEGGTQIKPTTTVIEKERITLYAHWSQDMGTVKFNANGGKTSETSRVIHVGGKVGTLPTATRDGYTFTGWFTSATGGTKITNEYVIMDKAGITVYAHWTANKYTVKFDVNGSTAEAPTSISATYNGKYGTLPTINRTGYTFIGWFTGKTDGTQIKTGDKVTITANTILYAHWKANTYKITFNGNGGTPSTSSLTVTYDGKYGTLPTATRDGYTFTGWFTSSTDGTKIESTSTVKIAKDTTLYAQWTPNTYTVTYDANGGTGTMATDTATYDVNYTAKENTFTRTGYTFAGWNENADGTGTSWTNYIGKPWKWTYTKSITLYAQWTPNTYTVAYDANGGTGTMTTDTATYDANYITKANEFTRTGYVFLGWNEKADGTGTSWTNYINKAWKWTYTKSITLYAQWTPNKYTVTFNANGGTVSPNTMSITYGSTYGTMPTPTKIGYTFTGWFTAATDGTQITSTTKVTGTANVTLYAHWRVNTYTVHYDINGGSTGTMSDLSCTYDLEFKNTRNNFARTGYVFKGWSTNKNATSTQNSMTARDRKYNGATYLNEDKAKNLTYKDKDTVTLYAIWQKTELGVMDYRYVNGAYRYFACVTTSYKTDNSSNAGALFVAMTNVGNLAYGSNAIWAQSSLRSTLNNSSINDFTGMQKTNTTVKYSYYGQFYDSNQSKSIDTRDNDLGIAGPITWISVSEGSASDYIFIPSITDIYNYGIFASKTSTQMPWFWDMNLDGVSDRIDMSDTVEQRATGKYWNDTYFTKTDKYYAQASVIESGFNEFFVREHNTGHTNSVEFVRLQGVLLPGTFQYGYAQYWETNCTGAKTTRAMYTMPM